MGGFSQTVVGKLLERSTSSKAVEEVLSAYCYAKYSNCGASGPVLRKLHLLTLYLRAMNMGHLLRHHYEAFTIVAYVVKTSPSTLPQFRACGDHTSSSTSTLSDPGREAWALATKPSRGLFHRVYSNRVLRNGGSGSAESSDTEVDAAGVGIGVGLARAEAMTRPRFERTTSEATMTFSVEEREEGEWGEDMNERRERLRLRAGRGAEQGLGLLSAPPVYDDSVAAYIERNLGIVPIGRAPGWENEELPGWTPRGS